MAGQDMFLTNTYRQSIWFEEAGTELLLLDYDITISERQEDYKWKCVSYESMTAMAARATVAANAAVETAVDRNFIVIYW